MKDNLFYFKPLFCPQFVANFLMKSIQMSFCSAKEFSDKNIKFRNKMDSRFGSFCRQRDTRRIFLMQIQ